MNTDILKDFDTSKTPIYVNQNLLTPPVDLLPLVDNDFTLNI